MKDLVRSWKFWLVVAIVAAIVIAAVVLYFSVPQFKVVVWETAAGILLVVGGFIGGYFVGKKYGVCK